MQVESSFAVGVNYWPRRSGLGMWRDFDAGEIREDVARIAALGLDAIRVFVPWDALQPLPQAVDAGVIDRVAQVAQIAAAANLRTLPTLCGAMGTRSFMPDWAAPLRDLYRGPLREAQLAIARAIGERFRNDPSIVAWDIGHAFSRVRPPRRGKVTSGEHASEPAAEPDVAEWGRLIARELRAAGLTSTAGTYDDDLIGDTNVRLGSLCAPFAFASMQGAGVRAPFARNRLDPEAVPFLAMIAAAFSFKPVLITGVGNPTCPAGKISPYERIVRAGEVEPWSVSSDDPVFATYPCLSEEEHAAYATAVLERLYADGRLGAYWWCWSESDEPERPPLERGWGIIRSDGSEKPVAAALAAFARRSRPLVKPRDMPMIASTYYYRTLPDSTRTLYDAYLGFIESRRTQ